MPILPAALELLTALSPVRRTLSLFEEALSQSDLVSAFETIAAE